MLNQVTIMGTLTQDVEIIYTQSGTAVATINIAVNERYKSQTGEMIDKAHFFKVTAFGRQAETINQYFRKGSRIIVEGSLVLDQWTAQDGTKRSMVSIKLNGFEFVDRKSDSKPSQQGNHQPAQQPQGYKQPAAQQTTPPLPEVDIYEDQIPF